MIRLPRAPYIRTALTALGVAAVLAVSAFVRAVRIDPVDAVGGPTGASLVSASAIQDVPAVDVEAVGANDIFQPDRTALPSRYRMPGESEPGAAPVVVEPPKPFVLGTVLSEDGENFATCQLPGGRPTLVHVGDRLGDYTVVAIERLKVVFKAADGKQFAVTAIRPGT